MHSVNCIEDNSKSGIKFWGAITDSYNNNTKMHHHHTVKNLKDHWIAYNKQVSLLNQIYNQESLNRQSGANDGMVLEITKHRYKNWTGGKLLGNNPSGGQGWMPHPQWMHLSPRVRLQPWRM
jgi:hypothetical protein